MGRSIRRFTLIAVSSLAAIGAFAAPRPIVIGALKGPSGIGMIKLFEAAPEPADGSVVKPVRVASVDLMTAKLISGEYDAGVLPINVAAKLYSSGIQIELAAVVGEGMLSFLSADASIRSLGDLRGKKISVAGQGATPDYLFRRLLKGAGLDPVKDLQLDYSLPYPEAAVALASGKISYAILPEPFATMARIHNPLVQNRLDLGGLWMEQTGQSVYPMTCFVVSSALAATRPKAVRTILDAYAASISWVVAHPSEAGALVEKNDLGLKADIATASIPLSAHVFKDARTAKPEIEALLGVFLEFSPVSVGGRLPDDAYYASF
jgi:NitT/TauT family transport system substrate-binding protein